MSDTYTKLFSSITESTVWGEPYSTRIVWVTLLAMADANGDIYGSVPGLARRANVTREEVDAALESFHGPDPDSRTTDNNGCRITKIDGGWRLLNHAKYRAIRSAEERREYMREYMRERREKEADCKPDCKQPLAMSTEITPPAPAPTPEKKEQKKKHARATRSLLVPMPPDFDISDAVRRWAEAKGFDRLREHLEHFRNTATARAYVYADWDSGFRNAIAKDWAGLRGRENANRASSRKLSVVEQVQADIDERKRREKASAIVAG